MASNKYERHRQKSPKSFEKDSFRTVYLSRTKYKGEKFKAKDNKAVVGKLKKSGKWSIQSILVPKKEGNKE